MNKLVFRIPLILLLTLVFLMSFSQSNYKKATIVTHDGDTLHGLIDYREWSRNPREFSFKSAASDNNVKKYTRDNIQSAVIQGFATYERFPVRISMNEVKFEKLTWSASQPEIEDTVFLRLLVKGKHVRLYSFRDEVKPRFYILENDASAPVELGFRLALVDGNVTRYPTYRQQLMRLADQLNDSLKISAASIETAAYTQSDLVKLITAMNGNVVTETRMPVAKTRSPRYYVATGLNFSTVTYGGENMITSDGVDNEDNRLYYDRQTTKVMPVISAGMDVYFKREIRRTYVKLDLSVAGFASKVKSKYRFSIYSAEELANTYSLSGVMFSFQPQLLFNVLNKSMVKVYVGAGPALHYMLTTRNEMYQKTNQPLPPYADKQTDPFLPVWDLFANVVVRTGVRLNNKLDISISGHNAVEITMYMDGATSARLNTYQLSVGYSFLR